jgi:hypothetical protein
MPRRPVIDNAQVAAVFRSYPRGVAAKLLALRRLILDVAASTEGVGAVHEALRWGQPSYLTERPRTGSTIRIDRVRSRPGRYAMYFHCQTTLVETFRRRYPSALRYEGNRAIVFDEGDRVPVGALRRCIALALTYHLPPTRKA